MQTKRQIRELLASAGVRPNRRFGQHFLVDLNLLRLLIDSAQIGTEDVVLEVGCGTGSLTQALAERACHVVAVEVDNTLAGIAVSQLAETDNIDLIRGDVLSHKGMLDPRVIEALVQARRCGRGRLLLVSNLPYDAATAVMLNLVRGPIVADAMVVTVQKEVAERMEAVPNSRGYGTLSVLLGATGHVKILRVLKPSVFWPPPGVDSAIVKFTRDGAKCRQIEEMGRLGDVVGLFMGHRRKMLRACVRYAPGELGGPDAWMESFARCGIDPTQRPEALSPEQYVELANGCGPRQAGG
jgi:16S rRNA (adenine1518-N6/adenine1519-N6)-dimethyltransferase